MLLLAPLTAAVEHPSRGDLRARLAHVLTSLDGEDAVAWFRAICMAQPAGLVQVPSADVRQAPTTGLLSAMALATAVCARARTMESTIKACENPRPVVAPLRAFDDDLKAQGVSPGTCAELTVASVAATLLQARLFRQYQS